MKDLIQFVIAFVFTVCIYLGCILLSALLILGIVGFLFDKWDLWDYVVNNSSMMLFLLISTFCLAIYALYIFIGGTVWRIGKPSESKSKHSKNTYTPD